MVEGAATPIWQASAGSLDPQGPAAESIADLWWLMLVLGTAVFLLFAALLVLSLIRRWAPGADRSAAHRKLVGRWIVGGGVAMPVVVIVVVFVATLQAMRALPTTPTSDALRVDVIGHQFWYEIRYPDEGIVTANELHLPVGRQVALRLTSADVIHSFWVPPLAGKLDMMPARTNTLVLQADEPGEHRSMCAEFCGLQHARMGLIVVAEPADEFDAWVSDQQQEARPSTAEALRGQQVFVDVGCARCHAGPGIVRPGASAPDLRDLADRRTLAAATLENTPENFMRWATDPQAIKTGVEMPPTDLTEEELDALLAYLGYER